MTATPRYRQELETAVALAHAASTAILPFYYRGLEQEIKQDGTPVTAADRLANEIIQDGLQKAFPHDGIISEELADISGERQWYVDPIDGTRGFIGHSDQFAIHIGLAEEGKPVLGLVYKPTTGEYYSGSPELGAWRVHPNGSKKPLQVHSDLEGIALIVNTTFLTEEQELLRALQPTKTFVSGSLGLRMMRIAEGIANVYIKQRKESGGTWDLCAPQAIVEAAGASVAKIDGTPMHYHGQRKLNAEIIAASSRELLEYVAGVMRILDQQ